MHNLCDGGQDSIDRIASNRAVTIFSRSSCAILTRHRWPIELVQMTQQFCEWLIVGHHNKRTVCPSLYGWVCRQKTYAASEFWIIIALNVETFCTLYGQQCFLFCCNLYSVGLRNYIRKSCTDYSVTPKTKGGDATDRMGHESGSLGNSASLQPVSIAVAVDGYRPSTVCCSSQAEHFVQRTRNGHIVFENDVSFGRLTFETRSHKLWIRTVQTWILQITEINDDVLVKRVWSLSVCHSQYHNVSRALNKNMMNVQRLWAVTVVGYNLGAATMTPLYSWHITH